MRLFKKESTSLDLNFSFAPEPQMRAAIVKEHVEAYYYYTGVAGWEKWASSMRPIYPMSYVVITTASRQTASFMYGRSSAISGDQMRLALYFSVMTGGGVQVKSSRFIL